jgi:hypothetical protein
MSSFKRVSAIALVDYATGALKGFLGGDGIEYAVPTAVFSVPGVAGRTSGVTEMDVLGAGSASSTVLTNPLFAACTTVNNYTQSCVQNLSNGVNSSADHIVYPNNTASDSTGFTDMGVCSSLYNQAAYSITGANDSYLFASAPTAAGTAGDLVFGTDTTGTSNGYRWYVNGFNKAIGAYSMKMAGTGVGSGMLQICEGIAYAGSSKVVFNNGATVTYTIPAKASYVYLTTSAAALATTYPAAAAALDGLEITLVVSAGVATATWVSAGATFVGAPAALLANTPVRFKYHHATTQWLIS